MPLDVLVKLNILVRPHDFFMHTFISTKRYLFSEEEPADPNKNDKVMQARTSLK